MRIIANGKPYEAPEGQSLPAFLESLGLSPARVVVERNGEPLTPAEARETALAAGDSLEIVRIVAGG
jgi:sulfur carrier protein